MLVHGHHQDQHIVFSVKQVIILDLLHLNVYLVHQVHTPHVVKLHVNNAQREHLVIMVHHNVLNVHQDSLLVP